MANEANLIPQAHKITVEEASKGGKASVEARRKKKTMSALASMMINASLEGKAKESIRDQYGIADDDITVASAMMAGQIKAAMKGDSRAFGIIGALAQQEEEKKAREEAAQAALLKKTYHMDLDMIPDNFHALIRDIRGKKHQEYVFEGGRGSTKSSDISQIIIELMRNYHDIHCVVVRKVGNTLKDSVYSKLKWAIGMQNFTEEFDAHKSPLEITLKATGQKIYFRGADEPEKIKSISPEFGYIAIIWFEELDQFNGEEEVRNITQSAIRGGELAWIFKSFNPPKTANNWANRYVQIPKANMVVHHSTYLEVPPEWLGKPFIEEAEHLKEVNPEAYEHEYLGIPNGNGGNVFEYLEIREITDDEIKGFDRIYQGQDWGWFPDPAAFIRLAYMPAQDMIVLIDEHYVNKTPNKENAEWILQQGYNDYDIICDSAEKKSVNDYRDLGLPAKAAIKGAGSVEYGMKWLQGRRIVIDPNRTPHAYQEFTQYEYERDKEGNPISGYPDANNHLIDATRYALERFCNKRGNIA
ncbi:MAG: PBSX family phage terminase large subunit [Prevotella sp.]|nr:PBSX family phage terminase large subunit [Candidatus Prevotella equi]